MCVYIYIYRYLFIHSSVYSLIYVGGRRGDGAARGQQPARHEVPRLGLQC